MIDSSPQSSRRYFQVQLINVPLHQRFQAAPVILLAYQYGLQMHWNNRNFQIQYTQNEIK